MRSEHKLKGKIYIILSTHSKSGYLVSNQRKSYPVLQDMTRVNTEASLVCLTSMVDDLVKNKSGTMDRPKWLGDISPAVIKLKQFVEIVCDKATHFMSFLDLIVCSEINFNFSFS